MRLRLPVAVTAALTTLAVVASASPASAYEGPNWWYAAYGVADFRAEGWDGAGVTIAVIDEQIDPDLPEFADAALTVDDAAICGGSATTEELDTEAIHGSEIVSLLVGNGTGASAQVGMAPAADVLFYGYGATVEDCVGSGYGQWAEALTRAVADGAQIVTTSYVFTEGDQRDIAATAAALAAGVVIVAANPNVAARTSGSPSSFNGVVAVSGFGADGLLLTRSESGLANVWPETTVVAPGDGIVSVDSGRTEPIRGASLAAPLVAGILALAWQKWPDATGDQLVQSLVHNTTESGGEAVQDTSSGFGYGPASLRGMMAADPAQYPDENPLFDKDLGVPTAAEVETAASPTATPTAGDEDASPGSAIMVFGIGGVVAGLVVAAGVVALVLVARRSRSRSGGGTG